MLLDDAIEILTKMLIKEDIENKNNNKKYVINKIDLYKFCIKLLKVIKKYE